MDKVMAFSIIGTNLYVSVLTYTHTHTHTRLSQEGAIRSVFSCELSALIRSTQKNHKQSESVWEVIMTSPYRRSGCAAISGKLVIASGLCEQDKTTTTVYYLSVDDNKWVELGEMPAARSSCSLAVINDQIFVIGGYVDPRNWISSLTSDVMATVNLKVPSKLVFQNADLVT